MPSRNAMNDASSGEPLSSAVTRATRPKTTNKPAPATVMSEPIRAGLVEQAVCARRPMTAMSSRANPAVAVSRSSANTGMFVTVPSSRCGSNSHSPSTPTIISTPEAAAARARQLQPRHHDELPSIPASVAGPSTVGTLAPRVVSTDAGLWVPRTADPER